MAHYIAIIGAQDGDEGKGKIVEYVLSLIKGKILSLRFQGGANAGHTLVLDYLKVKDKTVKLHQICSSIVIDNAYSLLGTGMYIHPRKLVKEIKGLQSRGFKVTPDNLGISSKAHITFDYHTGEDQANFNLEEHSSTGSGIKQTARDKYDRVGVRFVEFLDEDLTRTILRQWKFPLGFPKELGTLDEFVASYAAERSFLAPFLAQEHKLFNDPSFDFWLAEGAQGMLLSVDDGQYPGITSSNPGLPPHRPDRVIGVYKMYVSSVGIKDRPFVTEMDKESSSILVPEWGEFGTTTGKARHIGWFDALAGRYTADCAHMDYIAGTCFDRLESIARLGKKLKICVAYEVDGRRFDEWDVSFDRRDTLWRAKPIYQEMDPWDQTVEKDGKTLTPNAARYVECIEDLLHRKMAMMGIGAEHSDIIVREDIMNQILH